mmetsp:Transcript_4936/g.15942  ORF Transcript_4936/g.15942 Transcript_4936/m.15942 type:complete len:292 (-) Transcript_4936:701-1576(-)
MWLHLLLPAPREMLLPPTRRLPPAQRLTMLTCWTTPSSSTTACLARVPLAHRPTRLTVQPTKRGRRSDSEPRKRRHRRLRPQRPLPLLRRTHPLPPPLQPQPLHLPRSHPPSRPPFPLSLPPLLSETVRRTRQYAGSLRQQLSRRRKRCVRLVATRDATWGSFVRFVKSNVFVTLFCLFVACLLVRFLCFFPFGAFVVAARARKVHLPCSPHTHTQPCSTTPGRRREPRQRRGARRRVVPSLCPRRCLRAPSPRVRVARQTGRDRGYPTATSRARWTRCVARSPRQTAGTG